MIPMTPGARKFFFNALLEEREGSDAEGPWPGECEPSDEEHGNLVSSLCEDGQHRPALDIDLPARLVSSSTPGHFHLYFDDLALSWDAYLELLDALAKAGIVSTAWVGHCRERGMSLLSPRKWKTGKATK